MISKESARRLMIEKQGIGNAHNSPDKKNVYSTIEDLGCLQIDTISVVERAHYLTLWSRLGNYDKGLLDTLAYEDRKLFEYWAHAACYVPLTDYRYYLHSMDTRKKELVTRLKKRTGKGKELIEHVLQRITNEGPLASKDFDSEKKKKGGWWNRKDEKIAMDYLYGAGVLAISHRNNFQRYYDLSENVIPSWVDTEPPSDEERVWFFTEKTMDCLGVIQPKEARDYYQHFAIKLGRTSNQLETLIKTKENVTSLSIEGGQSTYYSLKEDAARLEDIDDDFDFEDVQLLIYFDNFMWNRERIQRLFGFESKLEIYVPETERVYGYYHLPVLYGDRIVARLEPKMDRKEDKLLIRGYWTEPGFSETEDYRDKLERNLEDFAAFHGTKTIEWLG
ncbi:MAG: crosslink repair DNA glycosylase YcaQ family protein [Candidatus Bathyarchaeota archaeon]